MSARDAATAIAEKKISSVELVEECLKRIDSREEVVGAWAYIDRDLAIKEASLRDSQHVQGPLHGVPIGIKDVIDTIDLPTEYGSTIYAGHRPRREASCVSLVRRAGGVILGKTVTTEFALYQPGKTTNPHNPAHTPGGSSSGSAAAVADFHVPVAMGTQTSGSIIRPASYCGVVGYKPTFNTFALEGTKPLAASLDTLGYLTRTVDDLTLMREVFLGKSAVKSTFNNRPHIAICRSPFWYEATADTRTVFEQTAELLANSGFDIEEVDLPPSFSDLIDVHEKLMAYEIARNYVREFDVSVRHELGPKTRQVIEDGWHVSTDEYLRLRAVTRHARDKFAAFSNEFDAVMVPAAPGDAPDISATGNPIFSRVWSLLGTPAIALPAGAGESNLPVGVQFVADLDADIRLIDICKQVEILLEGRAPQIAFA
ncbi:Putative amidase [Herminiimonas arsenicoxydans]|mgnify:FL=1|uniref:Amidase n=1 Tax=Herminiimonas arsenicoxydans TaxID=204773 RepID=A4G6W9_HERAR|nr:Putative amidase [Herminiimonas arsenicoxydans]